MRNRFLSTDDQVLELLRQGVSARQAAIRLGLSESAVKRARQRFVRHGIQFGNRYEAIEMRRRIPFATSALVDGRDSLALRLRMVWGIPDYARLTWEPRAAVFEWLDTRELEAA